MIWKRMPGEPDDAYAAFVQYRDSRPPRVNLLLANHAGIRCTMQQIREWTENWNWRKRAAAWDIHLIDLKESEIEGFIKQSAREVAAEHMASMKQAREIVWTELQKLLKAATASEWSVMKPSEITKMADMVIRCDRLIRGESTENVAEAMDLSKLSVDELKQLEELQSKLEGDTPDTDVRH